MRILEIREVAVPLGGGVSNAVVSFAGHTVSLVAVIAESAGRRRVGVAFNSIGRHAQGGILRGRLIPRVLAAAPDALLDPATAVLDPARVLACALTGEKPGGHGDRAAAAAALELACWDLLAKELGEPAHVTIARAHGLEPSTGGVPVYAAGGYYGDERGVGGLRDELAGYLDAGYAAVKIKIGGAPLAADLARVEAAIDVLGTGSAVAVDANGRFDLTAALDWGRELAGYGLRWWEEPGDPLDFELHRRVGGQYPGPLATGENLFSVPDVRNLLRYGGVRAHDVLQMDPGLSYGLTEYARMIALMAQSGIGREAAFPHGGHLINLHVVAGLRLGGCEAYPGVFQPFGGYAPGCLIADGRIHPTEDPGFGLEAKPGLAEEIARLVA